MQRKNNLLALAKIAIRPNTKRSNRCAFAMMMAIIVLVVIATIMALSLSLTVQTTKRTTDLYLYEQSALLAQSAAEYALLRISKLSPCKQDNFSFTHEGIYDINVSLRYVYTVPSPCDTEVGIAYFNTSYADTNGTVLMDITVTANPNGTTEPIRYFRRSIQKL